MHDLHFQNKNMTGNLPTESIKIITLSCGYNYLYYLMLQRASVAQPISKKKLSRSVKAIYNV